MIKRVFRSIFFVAFIVLLACIFIFIGVLYNYFTTIEKDDLKNQLNFIAQGVTNEGIHYFDGLHSSGYRITWINEDGTVLYDSVADVTTMENHADREEVISARETGYGESIRYSATILERQIYVAESLPDKTIIRVSIDQDTFAAYLLLLIKPILIVLAVSILISFFLASRLSKQIVKPLNSINLDEPLINDAYDELAPLLNRLEKQQRQISEQIEELQRKQEEFSVVTDSMNEGLIVLNSQGKILSINKSAAYLFNTDQSCLGHDILTVEHSMVIQEILQSAMTGQHAETIMEFQGAEYQIAANPILSNDQVAGVVLLAYDISERRKNEQMRREFTANVSHELKTPLHTISGCAELMQNNMVKSADLQKFSNQIYTEAQRLMILIDDIILLSQLDEQKYKFNREKFDILLAAKNVIKRLKQEAKSHKVDLSIEGEPAIIEGVPQLIEEMIFNLCDNAIKYNQENGYVKVTVSKDKQTVLLCIEDNGIGISKVDCSRIFERFYRVDKSHSKKTGGTGLGLSIVKHIAALHSAQIELESELGKGTTIRIQFSLV